MPSRNDLETQPDLVGLTRRLEAEDALEAARNLPHGAARTEALKKAGMLRFAADQHGVIFAPKGRPRK